MKDQSSKKLYVTTLIIQLRERQYKNAIERNNLLLDLIKALEPISKYEIAKKAAMGYNTVKQVCKWFEASDLIYVVQSIGENGMPVKLVSTKKLEAEQNGGDNTSPDAANNQSKGGKKRWKKT